MKQRRYKGERVRATYHIFEGGSESMDLSFQSGTNKEDFETTIQACFYAKNEYRHASMGVHGVENLELGKWKKLGDGSEVRTIIIKTEREYRPIEIVLFREVE